MLKQLKLQSMATNSILSMKPNAITNISQKKHREKDLVDQFIGVCSDYASYQFERFEENPDLVYISEGQELGFESVIISDNQASAECYFERELCAVQVPANLPVAERTQQIVSFLSNKLFDHWRRYSISTVVVFSLVDTEVAINDLASIAEQFDLPSFEELNIMAYYLCDGVKWIKLHMEKN